MSIEMSAYTAITESKASKRYTPPVALDAYSSRSAVSRRALPLLWTVLVLFLILAASVRANTWAHTTSHTAATPKSVASVAGTPITMVSFEHWMAVTVDLSPEITVAKHKVKPVQPKPPAYTACVKQLATGKTKRAKPTLKSQCEKEYLKYAGKVLGFLITSDWVLAEAAHLNMSVSEVEVQDRLEEVKAKEYPSVAQFNAYLVSSGETVADLLRRTEVELLESKISQSVTGEETGAESEALLASFQKEFLARWRPQTSCAVGFVMEDCKQYTQPQTKT